MKNQRVRDAIDEIILAFKNGDLHNIAPAVFKSDNQRPSDSWSFYNRLLMELSGTQDARGFRQWKEVGRSVKKRAKAFYILVPVYRTYADTAEAEIEVSGGGHETVIETRVARGNMWFKPAPVFRYEDTEGKELEEDHFDAEIPCDFNPLIKELQLSVETEGFRKLYYGAYSSHRKKIILASPEIQVFLHELSHAVDDKLNGIQPGQQPDQEIVAEFSAAVIGYLKGYDIKLEHSKEYIQSYANPKDIFDLLGRIEEVVNYIITKTSA